MRLLTVELDDKDMAKLEAIARARRTDPAVIVKTEVLKVLDD
jgi:predicted transcriptional regulator